MAHSVTAAARQTAGPQRAEAQGVAGASRPKVATPHTGLGRLQAAVGNRSLHRLLNYGTMRAQSAGGRMPGDSREREANDVAGEVMPIGDPAGVGLRQRLPAEVQRYCGVVQRKCACGGSASALSGECVDCQKEKLHVRPKLRISRPGDAYEREADLVASQVLTETAPRHFGATPVRIQRYPSDTGAPAADEPTSVAGVLSSPGTALSSSVKREMEERFGHDFSHVRVHTGAAADRSTRDVDALAYTVGRHVVFAAGRFTPETDVGRRLLAHELTHVLQQSHTTPMLARACNAVSCPAVPLPVGVFVPSWQIAEQCLQEHYKAARPGNTIGFNKDWVGLRGKNAREQHAIDCLRDYYTGKGYKPKPGEEDPFRPDKLEKQGSLQRQAEPDIFDFTDMRIMEITTPNGVAYRTRKIAWEVGLATRLSEECHVEAPNQWSIGMWRPDPCYQIVGAGQNLAGKLFFRTWMVNGILVYVPVVDVTREAVAAATAAAAVALWKTMARFGTKKIPGAGPIVAATAVAALIMLANGAEVSADPNEDSILEAFFKHAGDKGMHVPDDVKAALKKNKRLRELLVKAGKKRDMSDEALAAANELTKTLAEHADEFTDQELEELVNLANELEKGAPPNAKMTVAEMKQALKAKATGQKSPTPSQTGLPGEPVPGGGTPPAREPDKPGQAGFSADLKKRLAADKAASAIVAEISVGKGAGIEIDAAFVEALLAVTSAARPPLTEQEAAELAAIVRSSKGLKPADVLESVKKRIAARRPAAPGSTGEETTEAPATGPAGTTQPGPTAPSVSGTAATNQSAEAKRKAKKDPLWSKFAKDVLASRTSSSLRPNTALLVGTSPASFTARQKLDGVFYVVVRMADNTLLLAPVTAVASAQVGSNPRHWSVIALGGATLYDANGNVAGQTNEMTFDIQFGPPTPAPAKRRKR
jgi:hypothetical protein